MTKKALILVDIQNDFLPGGALPVPKGDEIFPAVNRLLEEDFDLVIATKDWHPPEHGSFADNQEGKKVGDRIQLGGIEQILWPAHCIQHTLGAEFSAGWHSEKVDEVFFKGTDPLIDSYSTFFDNEQRRATGLGNYLKENHIEEVYIAGLATDYCVKYSVLDARHLGFETFVVVDACRGIDLQKGDVQKALEEMEEAGAHLISIQSFSA